jgi:hypothetical protein
MVLANLFGAYGNIAMQEDILPLFPKLSRNLLLVFVLASLLNVVFAIGVYKWKKWGFWGFCVSALAVFLINIYIGIGPLPALAGLTGVLLLFVALKIGKEKAGWDQLE